MKRKLYIFNPENDMALACGRNGYNAPAWTVRFRNDLEALPAWLAQDGSLLLVRDAAATQAWLDERGLDVEAIEPSQLRGLRDVEVMPWGWSLPLCKQLSLAGLHRSLLPSEEDMEVVRLLAHRRTSIAVHQGVAREMNRQFCPTPVEIDNAEAVLRWAEEHPGCYIKTPWSGSGRGIYRAVDPASVEFARWCKGAIQRQGSVLCEVALDRVLDFALELKCDDGCSLVGYSVFASDDQNQYGAGIVDSPEALRAMIAAQYPTIDELARAVCRVVERVIAPHYRGYLGVDMLLYRTADGSIEVDPCVEVNLRCTMGLVTSVLGHRHGMRGNFAIVRADNAPHPITPIYKDTLHTADLSPRS